MKFPSIFAASLVLCFLFRFFLGSAIYESFWLSLLVDALVLSVALWAYLHQADKLEELEQRIRKTEEEKEINL